MLIERDAEVGALRAAVDRAGSGSGSSVLVQGPPGIGKSALLERVRADARRGGGFQILSARGGELEGEFPYGVVRQLFEATLRASDETLRASLLSGPARPAGALLGGEDGSDVPSDAATLEHAFYWLTANLSERGPLVVLVDDVHWADLSSVRSLIYLARRIADHPITLVMTTRHTDGTRRGLFDRLAAESTVVEPAPISADGVRRYLHERLSAADDTFSVACHTASGGNPFLVTELVGAVQASGIEPVAVNAGRVRTITAQNVMRSVLLRLSGLSADATPVARALAVLGECDQVHVVARLADVPADSAATAVDELRAAHILAPEEPLQFVHAIVHSAVYEAVPSGRRSTLHRSAARLLHAIGASPDAVAAHLLLTTPGSDPWVFEELAAAASTGLAASTPETAAAYLERALQESVAVDTADRVPLLLRLGASKYQTFEGGAVAPFREALALATELPVRLGIGNALASAYMTEQRYDECWALIDRLLAEADGHADETADTELFAAQSLYTHLSGASQYLSRVDTWRPAADGATRRDRSMLAVQAWLAMCRSAPADETASMARAALSTGTLAQDDTYYVTYEMAVWGLIGAGHYDEALDSLDAVIDSRREAGQLLRAATLSVIRAEVRRRLGRLDGAESDARLAADIIPPGQIYVPHAASSLCFVLLARGELEEARAALTAHGFDTAVPDGGVSDVLWLARGQLRVAEGDVAGGLEDIRAYGAICEELERRNPGHFPWRSVAANALVQLGRLDEAEELAREELALAESVGVPGVRGRSLSTLGTARRGEDAVETLTEAVDLLQGSPLTLDTGAALLNLGRALRLTGNRDAAKEPLRRALDLATRTGARPLAEQAHDELLAAGARPRRKAMHGPDALTPSERRVAALAAQGLTNRELAHTLFVTPKTIEAHLAATYRKLGVSGKADLARALQPTS